MEAINLTSHHEVRAEVEEIGRQMSMMELTIACCRNNVFELGERLRDLGFEPPANMGEAVLSLLSAD